MEGSETATRSPIREEYNPFSPDQISTLRSLTKETPVFFSPALSCWIVSRYDDVLEVLADTKRFSSAPVIGMHTVPEELRELAPDGDPSTQPGLINTDPPEHDRIRKLAYQAFNPKAINARAEGIERLVGDMLDRIVPNGECDYVAEFAAPLPITVLSELLGIPKEDEQLVFDWSHAMLVVRSPQIAQDAAEDAWRQLGEMSAYLADLIAERRQQPQEDFITRLTQATEGDEPMFDDHEILVLIAQVIPAGNETTRSLLALFALRLAEDPGLFAQLRDESKLIMPAIEEQLRYAAPGKGLFRLVTDDVKIGGVVIPRGDLVQVHFAGANRDAEAWEDPDEFHPDRERLKQHVGFGRGAHFCLGAPVARLESRIAIEAMLERMPNLRRANDEPLQWSPSPILLGLERLDLAWDT